MLFLLISTLLHAAEPDAPLSEAEKAPIRRALRLSDAGSHTLVVGSYTGTAGLIMVATSFGRTNPGLEIQNTDRLRNGLIVTGTGYAVLAGGQIVSTLGAARAGHLADARGLRVSAAEHTRKAWATFGAQWAIQLGGAALFFRGVRNDEPSLPLYLGTNFTTSILMWASLDHRATLYDEVVRKMGPIRMRDFPVPFIYPMYREGTGESGLALGLQGQF